METRIEKFKKFKFESPIKIIGGLLGKIQESSIHEGRTYVDVTWGNDDGPTTCDAPYGGDDTNGDDQHLENLFGKDKLNENENDTRQL